MNLEIVNGWLVERGAYPAEYPAGPEWGPQPYSDAEPLVRLETVPGYSALAAEIAAKALRDAAESLRNTRTVDDGKPVAAFLNVADWLYTRADKEAGK